MDKADKPHCCGAHSSKAHQHGHTSGIASTIDPVCGMTVDPEKAQHKAEYNGSTYYFCSAGCRTKFMAEPNKYLQPRASEPPAPSSHEALYTCPMHPEVRQKGPGFCPICGMALEPLVVTAEA